MNDFIQFTDDFDSFSQSIRKKFSKSSTDFWPLEQIYLTLNDHQGGFLLKKGESIYLGLKVEKQEFFLFKTYFIDVSTHKVKLIIIDVRKLITTDNRDVKIQWFGKFNEILDINLRPSFTVLDRYSYELELPKNFILNNPQKKHLIPDLCAYLAWNSDVKFHKKILVD